MNALRKVALLSWGDMEKFNYTSQSGKGSDQSAACRETKVK